MKEFKDGLGKYQPRANPEDPNCVYGWAAAATMVEALKGMKEPTRAALMESVRNLDVEIPILLPGIKVADLRQRGRLPDRGDADPALRGRELEAPGRRDPGTALTPSRLTPAPAGVWGGRSGTGRLEPLEPALLELAAQHLLVELADARLRDLVDDRQLRRAATTSRPARARCSRSSSRVSSRPPRARRRPAGARPSARRARAITAASCTAGWAMISFSSSTDEIHSPPDLITSLARSLIRM